MSGGLHVAEKLKVGYYCLLFIFIYCICCSKNENIDIPEEGSACGLVH
jgi:hypothetical protein